MASILSRNAIQVWKLFFLLLFILAIKVYVTDGHIFVALLFYLLLISIFIAKYFNKWHKKPLTSKCTLCVIAVIIQFKGCFKEHFQLSFHIGKNPYYLFCVKYVSFSIIKILWFIFSLRLEK